MKVPQYGNGSEVVTRFDGIDCTKSGRCFTNESLVEIGVNIEEEILVGEFIVQGEFSFVIGTNVKYGSGGLEQFTISDNCSAINEINMDVKDIVGIAVNAPVACVIQVGFILPSSGARYGHVMVHCIGFFLCLCLVAGDVVPFDMAVPFLLPNVDGCSINGERLYVTFMTDNPAHDLFYSVKGDTQGIIESQETHNFITGLYARDQFLVSVISKVIYTLTDDYIVCICSMLTLVGVGRYRNVRLLF